MENSVDINLILSENFHFMSFLLFINCYYYYLYASIILNYEFSKQADKKSIRNNSQSGSLSPKKNQITR